MKLRKTKKERDIMSKSQSRKGYAVGALVALVSSIFTFAPAQADANGPVTLLPTEGSTFNTIIGSPISLSSTQDPATNIGTDDEDASVSYYVVSNPDEAEITLTLTNDPSVNAVQFRYVTYNASGVGTVGTAVTPSITFTNPGAALMKITTTESKIAISAGYSASGEIKLNTIAIDTNETTTTTVTVQTLVDTDTSSNGVGIANGFDRVSKAETVVMYAPGSVTATTTIASLNAGGTASKVTVVYGNSVNPFFVEDKTSVSIFKQGKIVALSSSPAEVTENRIQGYITSSKTAVVAAGVITAGYSNSDLTTATDLLTGMTAMSDWDASIYSAQAYYQVGANYVTVGAASAVANVSAGSSTTVDGLSLSHVATLDTDFTVTAANATLSARSGTKALTINAQIRSGSADLEFANAELKAVLSENSLAAASSITITGAATALVDGGSAVTAYGRTDSDGKASFTINSNNGTKADSVNVHVYVKDSAGLWVSYTSAETNESGINVVWSNAAFSSFAASPTDYVSGANPSVTLKVKDQFGGPLNAIDSKPLQVYVVASFGGVADATKYAATANVVGGAATFTFTNFAPAGGLAQLNATLIYGGTTLTSANVVGSEVVNVYNTAVSSEIAVVDSFATDVSYVDFVTGDTDDVAVAAAVLAAGLSSAEGVAVTGNVLNTTGVGQPGVAVTVAAEGILFLADGVYSLGTATTAANEFGAFSVTAIAHTVYAKGTTVTITADGLSATTLLVTYLPSTLDDANLDLSWSIPANVVKNTTYAVTATLADKWGNPIAATTTSNNAVSILGAGSVEVNSVPTAAARNFDKNGQVTVFVRSVKDVAGPGSLTATLATGAGAWTYPTGVTGAATGTVADVGTFNVTNTKATAWDESAWSNALTTNIEVLDSAAGIVTAQKVNAGSFKGYVALYAKGYEGQRMSAKVGNDWVIVPSIPAATNDLFRAVEFVGAGVDISVRIYIDRVLVATIPLLTK
jgi:uncharacterized cupredoxin-like copper-binding protein